MGFSPTQQRRFRPSSSVIVIPPTGSGSPLLPISLGGEKHVWGNLGTPNTIARPQMSPFFKPGLAAHAIIFVKRKRFVGLTNVIDTIPPLRIASMISPLASMSLPALVQSLETPSED